MIHAIASMTATLCIAIFFSSTIVVELFGSHEAVSTLKSQIVMPGLFILIPALMITGASGFSLAKDRKGSLIASKKKRMPFIAMNGLFILLPSAIFLNQWAAAGIFDTKFYLVQALELLVGAINLTLMGMNIRDGLRLTGRLRKTKKQA